MSSCLICLRPVKDGGDHHARCARRLFGHEVAPALSIKDAEIDTYLARSIGSAAIPGAQRKLSMSVVVSRRALTIVEGGIGRFILKPPAAAMPHLPENEHLSMSIASLMRLRVPDFGLVRLDDGQLAYIVARFDRLVDGRKLMVEDLCQLAGLRPADKYHGTALDCAELVSAFSSEPPADLMVLFRMFVAAYWIGNDDLHRKNISLIQAVRGGRSHILSPTYDVVSTILYPDLATGLALPISDDGAVDRDAWLAFGEAIGLGPAVIARVLGEPLGRMPAALELIDASYLPEPMRRSYRVTAQARAEVLAGSR